MKKLLIVALFFCSCVTDTERKDPGITPGLYNSRFSVDLMTWTINLNLNSDKSYLMIMKGIDIQTDIEAMYGPEIGTWNYSREKLCLNSTLANTCDEVRNLTPNSFDLKLNDIEFERLLGRDWFSFSK